MTIPLLPCRTAPDLWFSPDPTDRAYAARQCHTCPLLLGCMRQALAAGEKYGVWGGVDFEARAHGAAPSAATGHRDKRRTARERTHMPDVVSPATNSPNSATAGTQALPIAS
ncbi:WhiB family transcriptional regulator [Streptomyces sp. NPDC049590]|uniref:WhiB family transcriptional regulator n=1 Tax=Streptomyces sp. NPDC049590 TaxID=3154834 RepID=UPI00342815C6